jgi:hypothetical protein
MFVVAQGQFAYASSCYAVNTTEAAALSPADSPGSDVSKLNGNINAGDPVTSVSRVDELTRQILLKEVELEKFNLVYKRETTKQGRWKGLRYAAFQEANFGCNLGGSIAALGERAQHFTNPKHVSANRVGMANMTGAVGSLIGGGAAALELGILGLHDIQARREGYSPAAARKRVLELSGQIEKLLAERDTLIKIEQSAPLLQAHAEVDVAEGRVLRDVTALSLFEYARFHEGSARYLAFQQAIYSFDFAKFTCSGLGSFFAYMSLHKHDRLWNARAGYLFLVSGALIVAAPFASRAIGNIAAKVQKHKVSPVSKGLEDTEIAKLEADKAALDSLCKEGKCSPDQMKGTLTRAYLYAVADEGFQDQLHQNLREQRAGSRVATQNYLSGLFIGGTKIGSGVLFTVVGTQDATKSAHSNRVTNYNLGVSAMLGTVGSATAVLDTARIQIQAEINRRRMSKQGLLPGQILSARLAKLDDMEQRLKATQ